MEMVFCLKTGSEVLLNTRRNPTVYCTLTLLDAVLEELKK